MSPPPMPTFRPQFGRYADRYVIQIERDFELTLPSDAMTRRRGTITDDLRVWTRAFERDLVAITGNPDGECW